VGEEGSGVVRERDTLLSVEWQILGSAYILGGTKEHLNKIYDTESEQLDPWVDSPSEVSYEEWREFLGKRE
jgi:hypothetical protein